jgi:hypothetical protein
MMRLNAEQTILLHDEPVRKTGGLPGLSNRKLLESALAAPFASFGKQTRIRPLRRKLPDLRFVSCKITLSMTGTSESACLQC